MIKSKRRRRRERPPSVKWKELLLASIALISFCFIAAGPLVEAVSSSELGPLAGTAATWPTFQGDTAHDGRLGVPLGEETYSEMFLDSRVGSNYSAPTLYLGPDGRFLAKEGEKISAIADGSVKWSLHGVNVLSEPLILSDRVVIGMVKDVSCVELETGREIWSGSLDHNVLVYPPVSDAAGRVMAADDGRDALGNPGQPNVYCFNETGQMLWKRGSGMQSLEGLTETASGLLILSGHSGVSVMVQALAANGSTVWRWTGDENDRFVGPSVSVAGKIVVNTGRELVRLNESGAFDKMLSAENMSLWCYPIMNSNGDTFSLARQTTGGSSCYLLSWSPDGMLNWSSKLDTSNPRSLQLSSDGIILAQTSTGLFSFTRNGSMLWRLGMDPAASSPIVGGNSAIYVLEPDRMTVFMPGQSRQALVTMVQYGLSAVVIVTATVILMLQYRSVMLRKKI